MNRDVASTRDVAVSHGIVAAILRMTREEVVESWRQVCERSSISFDSTLPAVLAGWHDRGRSLSDDDQGSGSSRHPGVYATAPRRRGKL